MFLKKLSGKQKENFFYLAKHGAMADNVFHQAEKDLLDEYCKEMEFIPGPDQDVEIEELLEDISHNASQMEKNIIYLELLGLLKADEVIAEEEVSFLERVGAALQVRKEASVRMDALLDVYRVMYSELYEIINE